MKRIKKKQQVNKIHGKKKEKKIIFKLALCSFYLIVMTILFVCAYQLYHQEQEIVPWEEAESVEDYAYINVSKMSETFAYYTDTKTNVKKQIHFVIEQENTGLWHTYLIAIDEKDYNKYKDIIDYTYERTDQVPNAIQVYGYPVIIDEELKKTAIANIKNFVPAENEVTITEENFEQYLTNSYLDTTIEQRDDFNIPLFLVLMIMLAMFFLMIYTIFDKKEKKPR